MLRNMGPARTGTRLHQAMGQLSPQRIRSSSDLNNFPVTIFDELIKRNENRIRSIGIEDFYAFEKLSSDFSEFVAGHKHRLRFLLNKKDDIKADIIFRSREFGWDEEQVLLEGMNGRVAVGGAYSNNWAILPMALAKHIFSFICSRHYSKKESERKEFDDRLAVLRNCGDLRIELDEIEREEFKIKEILMCAEVHYSYFTADKIREVDTDICDKMSVEYGYVVDENQDLKQEIEKLTRENLELRIEINRLNAFLLIPFGFGPEDGKKEISSGDDAVSGIGGAVLVNGSIMSGHPGTNGQNGNISNGERVPLFGDRNNSSERPAIDGNYMIVRGGVGSGDTDISNSGGGHGLDDIDEIDNGVDGNGLRRSVSRELNGKSSSERPVLPED